MKMLRLYLRLILLPLLIFTAALVLIRAQPYDDHELRQLLLPDGCPAPCFMGIRPGMTTVDEAMQLLQSNHWVGQIENHTQSNLVGSITWDWSDQKPTWITKKPQGEIYIENGRVTLMTIYSDIPLGATRLVLGLPDTEIVDAKADQSREFALYWAAYNQTGLTIRSWQHCGVTEPLRNIVYITLSEPFKSTVKHVNSLNDIFSAC
jgi:hypothetical protein